MGRSAPLPYLREADLTGPVRRALGSESAIPADWQLHHLGGGRGEITGGVYRIAGRGHDQGHPCATRARGRGCDVGRRPLTDCAAAWEMKDWRPFGVALRGVASNRLMLH